MAKRPKGFIENYKPKPHNRPILEQVVGILAEYAKFLPLTVRQIFYRMVGLHGYPKDENAAERLGNLIVMARRGRVIPFDAIRDDGAIQETGSWFDDPEEFWDNVRTWAGQYCIDRQEGQPQFTEIWVESAGMVPQIVRVAEPFGIPVYSGGGFDSLTVKHQTFERIRDRDRPTVALQIGDHDHWGKGILQAMTEDVEAFLESEPGPGFEPRRIVVTPEQIDRLTLPSKPATQKDIDRGWHEDTVQAEALAPDQLAAEVQAAIAVDIDPDVFDEAIAREEVERAAILERLDDLDETG